MNDASVTQLGLTVVYAAVGILLMLTERVEQSRALRIWTVAFFLFAVDALSSGLGEVVGLQSVTRPICWVALTVAGIAGVAGTIAFIGRPLPMGLILLGSIGLLSVLFGPLFHLGDEVIRAIVFQCLGVSFLWSAKLTFSDSIPAGIGRWVIGSAFLGAALYAMAWPVLSSLRGIERVEFFIDLSLVMWGAGGALLVHFERSRERIKAMADQELELRAQLERSERLEALGRLAGGVAHDFNNVLTTVIHGSELALRQLGEPQQAAEHLKLVLESARGASSFTRQLLALGRRRLPGRKPILVSEAIRGAMCMVRPSLLPSHTLICPPLADTVAIAAGEGQLEQVIVNLSLNALDAMPTGGILELRVEVEGDLVRLIVRDSGCGMDEATLKRVFEPFFGTKSGRGGTGLGLAAVYAIVKQHEGRIDVQSTPEKGSTFTVELPRCAAPTPSPVGQARRLASPSTIEILLVDDDESVLHTLSAGLAKSGYRVATAASADEAISKAQHSVPSLLLADVRLPGKSGLELVAQLRQAHPRLAVIMMTGHANDEEWESGKYGERWLLKPFTTQNLQDAIDSVLAG